MDPLVTVFLTVKTEKELYRAAETTGVFEPIDVVEEKPIIINSSESTGESESLEDMALSRRKQPDRRSKKKSKSYKARARSYNHTCEICKANFYRSDHLASHMTRHSDSRPHKCDVCSKLFKTYINLSRHRSHVHADMIKLHPCDLCNFEARSKGNLKKHKIVKHTEGYNFSCQECDRKFKLQSEFLTHKKNRHSGPCICDVCGKLYPNLNALYFHKNDKHTTKVRNFECETCKKRFMSQKNLNAHNQLHKIKYVCEQCGKEFKTKDYLTRHQHVHSNDKSYLCPVCGKTFTLLSSQQVHLLTHIGERPYVCDICGKSFTQRSPMMLHRRKQHPGTTHPPPPPIKIVDLLHGVNDKINASTT